jgi:hypothetical protein
MKESKKKKKLEEALIRTKVEKAPLGCRRWRWAGLMGGELRAKASEVKERWMDG